MDERKEKVIEIIQRVLDLEQVCDIDEKTDLRRDLWMDSLDAVELKMELENEFKIEVPDEASEKFKTVQDILDYLNAYLSTVVSTD